MDIPEGVCDVAWQAGLGSQRHHCNNAAKAYIIIAEEKYQTCAECLVELAQLTMLEVA